MALIRINRMSLHALVLLTGLAAPFARAFLLDPDQEGLARRAIAQLGSDSFRERREASQVLPTLGPGILPLLAPALKAPDPEVSQRSVQVLDELIRGRVQGPDAAAANRLIEDWFNTPFGEEDALIDRFLDQGSAGARAMWSILARQEGRARDGARFRTTVDRVIARLQRWILEGPSHDETIARWLDALVLTGDTDLARHRVAWAQIRGDLDRVTEFHAQVPDALGPGPAGLAAIAPLLTGDFPTASRRIDELGVPYLIRELRFRRQDWPAWRTQCLAALDQRPHRAAVETWLQAMHDEDWPAAERNAEVLVADALRIQGSELYTVAGWLLAYDAYGPAMRLYLETDESMFAATLAQSSLEILPVYRALSERIRQPQADPPEELRLAWELLQDGLGIPREDVEETFLEEADEANPGRNLFLALSRKDWNQALSEMRFDAPLVAAYGLPAVTLLKGWCQVQLGEEKEGRQLIELAGRMPLADPDQHAYLGTLLRWLEAEPQSIDAAYRKALDLGSIWSRGWLQAFIDHQVRDRLVRGEFGEAVEDLERLRLRAFSREGAMDYRLTFASSAMMFRARYLHAVTQGRMDAARALVQAHQGIAAQTALEVLQDLDRHGTEPQRESFIDQVVAIHRDLLREIPQAANLHNNLAWICAVRRSRLALAETHAREAVRLQPATAAYLDTFAEIRFQQGHPQEAEAALKRCLQLEPDFHYFELQLDRIRKGDPAAPLPREWP